MESGGHVAESKLELDFTPPHGLRAHLVTMTTTGTAPCLGLYKAQYTYTAQGEDEVSMEEDQLVFLLDNSDDECVSGCH